MLQKLIKTAQNIMTIIQRKYYGQSEKKQDKSQPNTSHK